PVVSVTKPKPNLGWSIAALASNLVFMLKLFLFNYKNIEKPNVIILSSMPIFPIIDAYWLKKKLKVKKLITEVRDLWPLTPIHLKSFSPNHPFIKVVGWFEKFAYKKSDFIVSVLPNAHLYINKISKCADKFKYIPNGIEINTAEPLKKIDSLEQLSNNKFIIGYTGTIGMANALEYLIDASIQLNNNPTIHFVIIGNGYLKAQFSNKTKGNSNISFIDKVVKSEIRNYIQYFDICYVSRYNKKLYQYGVSYNKYFDYMLAKKPILESSMTVGSPAELAKCSFLVPPENTERLVKKIKELQAFPKNELIKIGERGFFYVKKYHNFEYLSNLYLNLF
ncbi:MAG: glycosyltransferase family 4 protein, partial [Lutibacter sp.]